MEPKKIRAAVEFEIEYFNRAIRSLEKMNGVEIVLNYKFPMFSDSGFFIGRVGLEDLKIK